MTKICFDDEHSKFIFAILVRKANKAAVVLINANSQGFKARMGTIEPGDRRTLRII